MKDVELKLIAELMKNSRRSDRELAKAVRVSQPTVSRTIKRLEDEGIIKEYTMIPDFTKLGYELMGITLERHKQSITPKEKEEAKKEAAEEAENSRMAMLMMEKGLGLDSESVTIALYRSYSEYSEVMQAARRFLFLDTAHRETFLINLKDEVHFRPLTLSVLADHLLNAQEKKE